MAADIENIDTESENAFEMLLNVTEISKNLRIDLKKDIVNAVSMLRKSFSSLKRELSDKDNELQNSCRGQSQNVLGTWTTQAPSHSGYEKHPGPTSDSLFVAPPAAQKRNYSAIVGGTQQTNRPKSFKMIVKSKNNQSTEYMRTLLKTKVNPIELKVGINSLKSLKNGHLLIESGNKSEADIICQNINNKCGGELEANISMKRNPKIIIFSTPEEVTMENAVEALATQNEELNNGKEIMKPIREFKDRKKNKVLIMEISSEQRNMILGKKIKLGWNMCNWEDYIMITRCYKCSKFNHRAQDCKGIQTCPNCAGNHTLKECQEQKENYKCINCANYKKYSKDNSNDENHSALDKNCPCYQAAIKRYQLNIDY